MRRSGIRGPAKDDLRPQNIQVDYVFDAGKTECCRGSVNQTVNRLPEVIAPVHGNPNGQEFSQLLQGSDQAEAYRSGRCKARLCETRSRHMLYGSGRHRANASCEKNPE
jgi:hypothetical protein